MALAALFGAVLILPSDISPIAASLYTLIPGAFAMMMYGVVFSTVSEAGIPRAMTGTVIGIASIIGYMIPFIQYCLENGWILMAVQDITIFSDFWQLPVWLVQFWRCWFIEMVKKQRRKYRNKD